MPMTAGRCRYKAGQTEKVILRKLGSLDPEGKRHVIRLLRHFDYRGHLCLVFEPMVRTPACPAIRTREACFTNSPSVPSSQAAIHYRYR